MTPVGHYQRFVGSAVRTTGHCGHEWTTPYRRARVVSEQERVRLVCPVCGRQKHVTFDFDGRACADEGCETTLSRYNPGPSCFAHDEQRARAKFAAVMAA